MSELAQPEGFPGRFGPFGWEPPPVPLPFDVWEAVLWRVKAERERLEGMLDAVLWWLADLLAFGERSYGEEYAQALDASDYTAQSLNTIRWIGLNVRGDLRGMTSFWKSAPVGGLSREEDKRAVLENARDNGLSLREIRQAVEVQKLSHAKQITDAEYEAIYGEPKPRDLNLSGARATCPTCGGAGTLPVEEVG